MARSADFVTVWFGPWQRCRSPGGLVILMCVVSGWFGISKAMSVRAQEVLS